MCSCFLYLSHLSSYRLAHPELVEWACPEQPVVSKAEPRRGINLLNQNSAASRSNEIVQSLAKSGETAYTASLPIRDKLFYVTTE